MATWESVVRSRTDLGPEALDRLRWLQQEWALLADLGFSDLVLFVRTWDAAGWIAVAHVRPSTSATMFTDDPVGTFVPRSRATAMERARQSGDKARGPRVSSDPAATPTEPLEAVPVWFDGTVVAVVARYSTIDRRRIGELERQYLAACDSLLDMVAQGEYPPERVEVVGAAGPRVGDGMISLDEHGAIRYASPNARTCLRQLGVSDPVVGNGLAELLARAGRRHGPLDRAAIRIAGGEQAGEAEVLSPSAVVIVRAIPLVAAGRRKGAVVLVRDVTEVRQRERALLSKDATIREIHHRVKNNLQTVGALLRLQARRLPSGAPRSALLDAVARVGTIALVHDSLARTPGEQVDFDEIVTRVLAMARDAAAAQEQSAPPAVRVAGTFGVLSSDVATPLAMALSEILLNAMEHSRAARVWVQVRRDAENLELSVADDGCGFVPVADQGLGLQIVRTLVEDQLHGSLTVTSGPENAWPGEFPDRTWVDVPDVWADATTVVRVMCRL